MTKSKKTIYFDNAATSYPKPETVAMRVEYVISVIGGNPGRGSHRMALDAGRVIFETRESLSRLLNIKDASRIAFTKNATEGINVALKGLLNAGDHVVTSAFEHNSVVRCLRRLEGEGVKVTKVKGANKGCEDLLSAEDISAAITENTKMVVMTHASNVFGTIQPVAEIAELCRERGIIFVLDAAQTIGAIEVDAEVIGADILIGTGHKSLFGPQGTGFMYVREGLEPRPLIDGGTGEIDDVLVFPDSIESGTMNTPGIGGLGAGVDFVLSEGIEKIRAHEVTLIEKLLKDLSAMKGVTIYGSKTAVERCSLVAFNIDGVNPKEAGTVFDREFQMMLRCGTHCAPEAHRLAETHSEGSIRVSPGYFNTTEDIDEFLEVVRHFIKG
jgi:cysteine desulfurase family protein